MLKHKYWRIALLAAAVMGGVWARAADDEADVVKEHRETYFTEVRKLDAKYTEQRKNIDKKMSEAVKVLEERYAAQGNLEGVLAAREILQAVDDPFEEVVVPARNNIDELKRVLDQREQFFKTLDTEETKTRDELKTKYIAFLERVKGQLTVSRKIDEALAIHNEIERLKNEQKLGQKLAAPAVSAATPQNPRPTFVNTPPPPRTPPENARTFMTEADVIDQLKTLTGTSVTFNGRVKTLENDNSNRGYFLLNMEGGIKIRLAIPDGTELAKKGGASILKVKDQPRSYYYTPPPGEEVLGVGTQVAIQTTIAKGVVHHAAPASFLNAVLIGSSSAAARSRFKADCGGPCPALTSRFYSTRICDVCGNERTDAQVIYYSTRD